MPANLRAPKSTKTSVAFSLIVPVHGAPRFDLRTESWIPVLAEDGSTQLVGLRDALLRAHTFRGLAVIEPIMWASVMRFLGVYTCQLLDPVRARRDASFRTKLIDAFESGSGFAPDDIDALLELNGKDLFLFHPCTPFLQDIGMRDHVVKADLKAKCDPRKELYEVLGLMPHLAGGTQPAWWYHPDQRGGLSFADTALALVARWFYRLSGNEQGYEGPNGKTTSGCTGGYPIQQLPMISHFFRRGETLFHSLAANVLRASDSDRSSTKAAWAGVPSSRYLNDISYRLSVSGTGAFLLEPDQETDQVTHTLRAHRPGITKDALKEVLREASIRDPHAARYFKQGQTAAAAKKGAPGPTTADFYNLRLDSGSHSLEHLHSYLARTCQGSPEIPSVIDAEQLLLNEAAGVPQLPLDVVSIDASGGISSGREVSGSELIRLPAAAFGLTGDARRALLQLTAAVASNAGTSRARLLAAVKLSLDDPGTKKVAPWVTAATAQSAKAFLSMVEVDFPLWQRRVLAADCTLDDETGQSAVDEVVADALRSWHRALLTCFDQAVRPYELTVSCSLRIARERAGLCSTDLYKSDLPAPTPSVRTSS